MSLFKGWPSLTELFFGKEEDSVKPVKKATPKAMPKATPKAKATPKVTAKPKVTVDKKPTKKELAKMTKVELEAKGRTVGIELDRRETKDKLVKALHKVL